jgi:hypothetical protein
VTSLSFHQARSWDAAMALFRFPLLVLLALIARLSLAAVSRKIAAEHNNNKEDATKKPTVMFLWEEESPAIKTPEDFEKDYCPNDDSKKDLSTREWVSCGRLGDEKEGSSPSSNNSHHVSRTLPHPLRTDLFRLKIRWKFRKERRDIDCLFQDEMEFEFHPDGMVRGVAVVGSTDDDNMHEHTGKKDVLGFGEWQLFPYGLEFSILAKNKYRYFFQASLHLNPFGEKPKLSHGTVLRESLSVIKDGERDDTYLSIPRNKWFRPVVATFQGVGIGKDTADFSYKSRGVGLSS